MVMFLGFKNYILESSLGILIYGFPIFGLQFFGGFTVGSFSYSLKISGFPGTHATHVTMSLHTINPIHHDTFSNRFIMRELIINSIWIIDMKNSLSIFMSYFLALVVELSTSKYNSTGPRFKSWVNQLFFP